MEFLSSNQIQNYEDILVEIDKEFKRSELLKQEYEEVNKNVVVTNLAQNQNGLTLSNVIVKIFADIMDLYCFYDKQLPDISELAKHENIKFFLIEIYTTEALLANLSGLDWLINICIKNDDMCVSKTIKLSDKIPIMEVLPVDENVIDCVVETNLWLSSGDQWILINFATVHVDISYHLTKARKQSDKHSDGRKIVRLTENYNKNLRIKNLGRLQTLEYKLTCSLDATDFVVDILKHCYYTLGLELFGELTYEVLDDILLKFSHGYRNRIHEFNFDKHSLVIRTNFCDMPLLKRFLYQIIYQPGERILNLPQNVSENINEMKKLTVVNIQDVKNLYHEVRKTWSKLSF